jgi:hypothetical protein
LPALISQQMLHISIDKPDRFDAFAVTKIVAVASGSFAPPFLEK